MNDSDFDLSPLVMLMRALNLQIHWQMAMAFIACVYLDLTEASDIAEYMKKMLNL
jgi:hypothetical protein